MEGRKMNHNFSRCVPWLALSISALAIFSIPAASQTYPTRPIRLVVAQAVGSSGDILSRILSEALGASMGQQVVVDNRPGAGGTIGASIVAKASPDGYTLMMATNATLAINIGLFRNLPYHPVDDFAPISLVSKFYYVLLTHPSLPAKSVKELVALARSRPQELTFASGGNGTGTHLSGEMLKQMTGIKMLHVPYKGTTPGLTDLVAGQVSIMFAGVPPALPYVKLKRLRALAVTGAKRSSVVPEIPTMAEAGVSGYEAPAWDGLVAPAGTPPAIIKKLNLEITDKLRTPEIRDKFAGLGLDAIGSTPQAFGDFIQSEIKKWGRVIKESGAKVQ
jgi:tripartite-type tricarboxylate transporter receptor subunit TctC